MRDITQTFFRERVLEQIRATEFSDKPSRLSSAFCLETLEEAHFYRDNVAGRTQIVYEVELVDPNANRHRADYNKVQPQPSDVASRMEDVARDYWRGENIQRPELVVATALRVISQAA